jgi:amino acid adenylation domain-containing protein
LDQTATPHRTDPTPAPILTERTPVVRYQPSSPSRDPGGGGDGNEPAVAAPGGLCLHHLFEQQAARTPDAVAVVAQEQALSYAELDRRAQRLARRLRALGVGPDVLVGLCVERSLALPVGLLAILKAGGAYVPLDPADPRERLAHKLADTRAQVLLTQRRLSGVPAAPITLFLDEEDGGAGDAEAPPVAPEHLAYVLYTSGSTGQPKGVERPHRALVNLIRWHERTLLRGARTLQFAPLGFDACCHELFAAWASGGSAFMIPEEARRDVPALVRFLADHAIEKVILPVVVLQQLAEFHGEPHREPPEPLRALREVTTTGDPLHLTSPMGELFKRLPGCALHNHYGPSETHVVTALTLPADPAQWPARPSIGRPIDNTQIHILDAQGQPAPVGASGELFVGGAMLARGYLGRPELTAERFVPDPSSQSGARLYRTGDLARWNSDGTIELLGRADHPVKIRGHRVEPGEIEAARPRPGSTRPELAEPDAAPRSESEASLCALLAEVLGLDRVGVNDSFFELGGDSLRAVRAFARIRQRLGVELGFAQLSSHPTAAGIAALIENRDQAKDASATPDAVSEAGRPSTVQRVPPELRPRHLPLSVAQERLWFLQRLMPGCTGYSCPSFFRLHGPLDAVALRRSLDDLSQRHDILRTLFPDAAGQPFQQILPTLRPAWTELDLSQHPSEQAEAALVRALEDEALRPFDLVRGPLLRAGLVRLGAREHALWLNLHHLITDGRSMAVLLHELALCYAARSVNQVPSLPPLPLQFADYALWQREPRQQEAARADGAYWQARLAGCPQLLALPTDFPRPAVQSHRGGSVSLSLDPELTQALRGLGARHQATLTMVVLAGFAALLHRRSGQDELLVGIPSLGRDRVETESMLGSFVHTLPLRLDLGADPGFAALLQLVRRESLAALEHDALPLDRLVHELRIERSAGHSPLIQVALAPQPPGDRELHLPGLRSARIPIASRLAVFDLTLYVWEEAGGLTAELEYATDLFQRETAVALLAQLERLLRAAAHQPDLPISRLPLLSPDEERHLLEGLSGASARLPAGDASLPDQIAAQAAQRPDAVAVLEPSGRCLRYAELDQQASQIARAVRSRRRSRRAGGAVRRALARVHRRHPRHPARRRRVPAARSALPDRAPGVHAPRRGAGRDPHAARAAHAAPGALCALRAPRRRGAPVQPAQPRAPALPRRARGSGVHAVHLGLDRPAQGSPGRAPQPDAADRGAARGVRRATGRSGAAARVAGLRRVDLRAGDDAERRRDALPPPAGADADGHGAGAAARGPADHAGDHAAVAADRACGGCGARAAGERAHAGGGRGALPRESGVALRPRSPPHQRLRSDGVHGLRDARRHRAGRARRAGRDHRATAAGRPHLHP